MLRFSNFLRCASANSSGSGASSARPSGAKPRKEMSDFEKKCRQFAADFFNDSLLGYTARVGGVLAFLLVGGGIGYNLTCLAEESKPIAKRWFPRYLQISFIERINEPGTDMWIYRFALPNTYDYAGFEPVQSVELMWDNSLLYNTRRYLTPISHPEQRGIIEFGVKHHSPGDMTFKLNKLKPGEKVYMGRWIKEFKYRPNQFDEIGFIAGNSGITPLLQILTTHLTNKEDKTKFKLLYVNAKPSAIPFAQKLNAIEERFPDRLGVTHLVQIGAKTEVVRLPTATALMRQLGKPLSSPTFFDAVTRGETGQSIMGYDDENPLFEVQALRSVDPNYQGYVGMLSKDLIMEAMPPPNKPRSAVLVCLPGQLMAEVSGRSWVFGRETYWQGLYRGILKEIGYPREQVYKFGYTIQGQFLNS